MLHCFFQVNQQDFPFKEYKILFYMYKIWRSIIKLQKISKKKSPIVMKIRIIFTPQALKNIKSVLESIYKLVQSQTQLPQIIFVYFINSKNIRFLIDSQISPIVISIGSQMINHNESAIEYKQGKQVICARFQNSQMFFDNLIGVLQKQDSSGLVFQLRKQILDKVQRKFFKLTLRNNDAFLSRILVQTPKYDIHQIKYHGWICGVQQKLKLAEITIYTEELCNIMRYLTKLKPSSDKKLLIKFNIPQKTYFSKLNDQRSRVYVIGQFKLNSNYFNENDNLIQYEINVNDLKMILQVIRKYKQLKVILTKQMKFVIAFVKEDLYVCHLDMSHWVRFAGKRLSENINGMTKIQQPQQGGMRWNR